MAGAGERCPLPMPEFTFQVFSSSLGKEVTGKLAKTIIYI